MKRSHEERVTQPKLWERPIIPRERRPPCERERGDARGTECALATCSSGSRRRRIVTMDTSRCPSRRTKKVRPCRCARVRRQRPRQGSRNASINTNAVQEQHQRSCPPLQRAVNMISRQGMETAVANRSYPGRLCASLSVRCVCWDQLPCCIGTMFHSCIRNNRSHRQPSQLAWSRSTLQICCPLALT